MAWGFERGRIYNRRADIHARLEASNRAASSRLPTTPVVLIITGEEGLTHGYADRLLPDGGVPGSSTAKLQLQRDFLAGSVLTTAAPWPSQP